MTFQKWAEKCPKPANVQVAVDPEMIRGWLMKLASDTAAALKEMGIQAEIHGLYQIYRRELTLADIANIMIEH